MTNRHLIAALSELKASLARDWRGSSQAHRREALHDAQSFKRSFWLLLKPKVSRAGAPSTLSQCRRWSLRSRRRRARGDARSRRQRRSQACGRRSPASEEANDGASERPGPMEPARGVASRPHALGGAAHFPFGGPPWLPFIRWAQRAGPVYPSPIGPLVHPDFGLWHAYRGAIAFRERLALPPRDNRASPCAELYADRPMPVVLSGRRVLSRTATTWRRCVAHIESTCRRADASMRGMPRPRHACPVGRADGVRSASGGIPHAGVPRREAARCAESSSPRVVPDDARRQRQC